MSKQEHSLDPKVNSKSLITPDGPSSNKDDESLPKYWTKKESQKRSGKFYYFNVKTRESLWEHPAKALEREERIVQNAPKATASTAGTSSLKSTPTKDTPKTDKKSLPVADSGKITKFKPFGLTKALNTAKERLEALRKQLEDERKAEEEKKNKQKILLQFKKAKSETKAPPCIPQEGTKALSSESGITPKSRIELASKTGEKAAIKRKINTTEGSSKVIAKSIKKDSPKKCSETIAKIVNKAVPIKDALKTDVIKFKIPKKIASTPLPIIEKVAKAEVPNLTAKVVPDYIKVINSEKAATSVSPIPSADEIVRSLPRKVQPVLNVPPPPSPKVATELPKYSPTPITIKSLNNNQEIGLKSPANDRLSQLRLNLLEEASLQSSLIDEDTEMTDLSNQSQQDSSVGVAPSEDMDWEDVPEAIALREVVTIRETFRSDYSSDNSSHGLDECIPAYRIHLFDRIDFKRFVFLVVDTNIFLSNLKGLERLVESGFPEIGQPILVLPYCVLQELDKIKQRELGSALSLAATHAIGFLNRYLKQQDARVKGQSAAEAMYHLVPIENPDDNILNCCLQVGQIITGCQTELLLLSNDVNLRNKALVNGVQAVSFVQLLVETHRVRYADDDRR